MYRLKRCNSLPRRTSPAGQFAFGVSIRSRSLIWSCEPYGFPPGGSWPPDSLQTVSLATWTRFPQTPTILMAVPLRQAASVVPGLLVLEGVSSLLNDTFVHPSAPVNPKIKIPRVVDRISEISPEAMTLVTGLSTEPLKHARQMRYFGVEAATVIFMSRRLEVELTSKRADGSYTWRAAGAKQPKGELDGAPVSYTHLTLPTKA